MEFGFTMQLLLLSDWKRPPARPCHTWLRDTEPDLRPLNLSTRARRQALENTGVPRWSRLRPRRVCGEEMEMEKMWVNNGRVVSHLYGWGEEVAAGRSTCRPPRRQTFVLLVKRLKPPLTGIRRSVDGEASSQADETPRSQSGRPQRPRTAAFAVLAITTRVIDDDLGTGALPRVLQNGDQVSTKCLLA